MTTTSKTKITISVERPVSNVGENLDRETFKHPGSMPQQVTFDLSAPPTEGEVKRLRDEIEKIISDASPPTPFKDA